jgi:hypothetical protein
MPEEQVVPGTEGTAQEWARAYGIELSVYELDLLSTRNSLLDPIERQRAFLLRMALRPESCPACKWILCQRSAWARGTFDPGTTGDGPGYQCPNCSADLIHRSGIIVSEHWMELAPGQTVTITTGPEAPDVR